MKMRETEGEREREEEGENGCRGQRKLSNSLELELQEVVNHQTCAQRTKFGSSGKALCSLNN